MPWTAAEAEAHTKKATTPALQAIWADVANATLKRTGNDGLAIREANSVVAHRSANDHHMGRDKRARSRK